MKIILVILLLVTFVLLYYKSKRNLHMIQQNIYNENNRYGKWIWKNLFDTSNLDLLAVICGLYVIYFREHLYVCSFMIIIVYCYMICKISKFINNDQNKKPLVVTKRVRRLIYTTSLLYLIPFILLYFGIIDINLVILIISIMVYFNNIVIYIVNIINYPIERIVYHYYRIKAMKKIDSIHGLKIIGITGSYGKTSSKNILNDILSVKYNVFPTPKSINTFNGIIMAINNKMDKFNDVFIAEMGAYVKGEIGRLCKLVRPKYGILTRIGTAHLETFGSQENIQIGKFELIESLPKDGFGILNGDDPLQVNYKLKNKVKIIWIGIKNKDVDVAAEDIKISSDGTSFNVVLKGDKTKYKFSTKLLGEHNVYNILAGIACGLEFGISIKDLIEAVREVKSIEHRLEIKKIGNFYQIDDAYNSNPIGAMNACKVLGMVDGVRVVVTPGMIELGDKEDYYNREFGKQIVELGKADYVVLIGSKKTKPIKAGLLEAGMKEENIIIYNDVRESYNFVSGLVKGKKEVYALYENDLPDTFNE